MCPRAQVMVVEIWRGDNRVCPHRCNQRHGVCRDFGPQPAAGESSSTAATSVASVASVAPVASDTLEGTAATSVTPLEGTTVTSVAPLEGPAATSVASLEGSTATSVASGTLEGSAAREVLGHCLDAAEIVLAHTAFAGRAIFAGVSAIQHQSSQHSDREENVEVRFDGNSSPIASVYACRDINRDEMFIM